MPSALISGLRLARTLVPTALAAGALAATLAACSSLSDDGPAPPRFERAAYVNGDTARFVGTWTWVGRLTSPESAQPQRYLTTPLPGTITGIRVLDGRRLALEVDGAWQAPQPYRFVVTEPTLPDEQSRVHLESAGLSTCGGTFALDARHFATVGSPCDGEDDFYRRL